MFHPIEDIVRDFQNGKIVILLDDENRENEGDMVVSAQHATPAQVNFMVTHARGLLCLAITSERAKQLRLPLMSENNESPWGTAFTMSVDAKEGITTGISAYDRSHTIQTVIDPQKTREDLVVPGRMFPLIAQDGGVLKRRGHTEASVDLAYLAGHVPAAVICEIMKDDGTMARRDDLCVLAQKFGLKMGHIEDLVQYRIKENLGFPLKKIA